MKQPDGAKAIDVNDAGLSFSVSMAEYSIALYMRTVLEEKMAKNPAPEVTIIAPNNLQRDLIREIYEKKKSVSNIFSTAPDAVTPHIVSWPEDSLASLPLEMAIFTDLETSDVWNELKKLAESRFISKRVVRLSGVVAKKPAEKTKGKAAKDNKTPEADAGSEVNTVYKEVRALLNSAKNSS